MKKSDKKTAKNTKIKEEVASEMSAKDLSWQLFEKTKNINFYTLYSALKDDDGGE